MRNCHEATSATDRDTMSCPNCRTDLEHRNNLYCPECDVLYHSPANLRDISVDEVGCLDEANNVFYAKIGNSTFIVKQPRASDLPLIREGLKLASEYTFLRFPSLMWRHPEGVCHFPLHKKGALGTLFLIMVFDGKMVGHSHHKYWRLTEETQEKENFPISVGSLCGNAELCILDTYQRQGIGSIYAKVSDYIARHNGASFIMGETFKEGGMLNIRLKSGWTNFGERKAEDGSTRILIGKPLK